MSPRTKRKVIITAALTGGGHGKEANPNLPEQPGEIIQQAIDCQKAGASIVHIHARDKKGKSTMDLSILGAIQDGIRASTDLIVQLSTGAPSLPMEERIAPLKLKPDMISLNTFLIVHLGKEVVPAIYTRPEIEETAKRCQKLGVKPDIAVVSFSCIDELENLIDKGLVDKPYVATVGLDMGAQGTVKGTSKNLFDLVERLPEGTFFNASAHGDSQLTLVTIGMLLGGNVRVGMEDNVYYAPGKLAKSNAEFVARAARLARELDLDVATPNEARKTLQIDR